MAIEPGSWYWHQQNLKNDKNKRLLCKAKGIRLLTIYDSVPHDKMNDFEKDYYLFEGELNEPGYARLKKLVTEIFKLLNIHTVMSAEQWDSIINKAHTGILQMSHDDFVREIYNISPDIKILGRYQHQKSKISVECLKCGYKWSGIPANLLSGAGCIVCAGLKKKTTVEFIDELKEVNPSVIVTGEYINTNTAIGVQCKKCGHMWNAIPNGLLRGSGCPKCAGNIRKSNEQFLRELQIKHPTLRPKDQYATALSKIVVHCNVCGLDFKTTPNRLLNGHGCPKCGKKLAVKNRGGKTALKTNEQYKAELAKVNSQILVIGDYINSKSHIHVKCLNCGNDWTPQAGSLLRGTRCPVCARNKRKNEKSC